MASPSTSSLAKAGRNRSRRVRTTQSTSVAASFSSARPKSIHRLTTQTFFLEPLESAVLFAAPRVVAIQGDLPFVRVDGEGSVQSRRHDFERIMYTAISDTNEPRMDRVARRRAAATRILLSLPSTARRSRSVASVTLATAIILHANASNRYDAAKAIEAHLQREYGYSLEMKARRPRSARRFSFQRQGRSLRVFLDCDGSAC